jgi:PAS domain S-box-containing protein
MKKKRVYDFKELRNAAEAVIEKSQGDLENSNTKFKGMLEELRIYQVELEMQNEELIRAGQELEEMESKYEALYELAPCGYLTLNSKKEILQSNKKAATLLGVSRINMIGESIVTFIASEDQPRLVKYYKQVKKVSTATGLKIHNHPPGALYVELETHVESPDIKNLYYQTILIDCSERVRIHKRMDEQQEQLKMRVKELNDKNIALGELLGQVESGRSRIEKAVTFNTEKLLIPLVNRLRAKDNGKNTDAFKLLEKNIKQIASQFGLKVSGSLIKLSTKEIEISNMIRAGFSSKEIASNFDISLKTVETHRRNIRKKLGIANKEVNLTSYLNAI